MKIIGIDWGSKRVGTALASDQAKIAAPHKTLANDKDLTAKIAALCQDETVELLVIGLPLNMQGEETAQTAVVRQWGETLAKHVGLPLQWQAESLTSVESAHSPDVDPVRSRSPRGGRSRAFGRAASNGVDSAAAAIILQDYLNTL